MIMFGRFPRALPCLQTCRRTGKPTKHDHLGGVNVTGG
jgi:hypothetical protein